MNLINLKSIQWQSTHNIKITILKMFAHKYHILEDIKYYIMCVGNELEEIYL